ncbi:putative O-methyltransferase [Amylocarpus encephaloides]|uniref:O-methyltransferase n=1 Tax=Amylocarpus encephaloides TaxID=45428 RepID=A0A9P7YC57_9HELO|nr:putative O-methyltransferase [Amylocarpus encephaloides]
MSSTKKSRIIELSNTINAHTIAIDKYYAANGIPPPSFDIDYPADLPEEIHQSRNSVLEATDELTDLMLGARALAECSPPQHTSLIGVQAICRYDIASKVPANEEVSYATLSQRCGLPVDDLMRIMRLAISQHIFKEPRKGFVAHNAASKMFVGSQDLQNWIYIALDEMWPSAAHMLDAMDRWKGSGEPYEAGFNIAKDTDQSFFQSMKHNQRRKEAFSNVMTYMQGRQGFGNSSAQLLSSYDWNSVGTIVDIGGGQGSTCVDILEKYPEIKCTVQDTPEVIAESQGKITAKISENLVFMEHDFFTEQPVKNSDVYLLRWVLHDWSDQRALMILRQLVPALKYGANVVIQEFIVPEPGIMSSYHEKTIRCMDLAMKAAFNSKEREIGDWIGLFAQADDNFAFVDAKVPPGSNLAVLHFCWKGK